MTETPPTLDDVRAARTRITPYIKITPVRTSPEIDRMTGCEVIFKCENLQHSGAFKIRGATNALLQLDDMQKERGVITHSSGNHGGALALSAKRMGIKCVVVMPHDAPNIKKQAVTENGAEVVFCEPRMDAREAVTRQLITERGLHLVHPYDDAKIIAGQGTVVLELLEQVDGRLDVIILPLGGGGLASGACIVTAGMSPTTGVIGVEPEAVSEACASLVSGTRQPATGRPTSADGLQAGIGEMNFAIVRQYIGDIVTVSEQQIADAVLLVKTGMEMLVEPSAAVPLAALVHVLDLPARTRVGVILSGGNTDLRPD